MGQLAVLKQGVIGLLTTPDLCADEVRTITHYWGAYLDPSWKSSGYLLLVGETDIIPSWQVILASQGKVVQTSDAIYADTSGFEFCPELSVGRILGCYAFHQKVPIRSSVDVAKGDAVFRRNHHQNSNAYCLSGTGDYEDKFWDTVYGVGEILKNEFFYVGVEQGRYVVNQGTPLYKKLRTRTIGLTVLYYCGHGSNDCWCGADTAVEVNFSGEASTKYINFGHSRPLVFAASCLTGRYDGIANIARSLFLQNAGVYIGSTEISYVRRNHIFSDAFFTFWVNHPDKSVGKAFKELKVYSSGDSLWSSEYNYYGDPKFGIETP